MTIYISINLLHAEPNGLHQGLLSYHLDVTFLKAKPTLHFIVTAINHVYYHSVQSVHGIRKSQLCSMYIRRHYDCNLRHHVPTIHIDKLAITFANLAQHCMK